MGWENMKVNEMEHNNNLRLKVENTDLSLNHNSNLVVEQTNSKIEMRGTKSCKLYGSSNTFNFSSDANTKIEGCNNEIRGENNRNLKISGDWIKARFLNNRNANVNAQNSNISAESNSNVKIEGDSNNLDIKDTKNHIVRPAPSGGSNKLEIIAGNEESGVSVISKLLSSFSGGDEGGRDGGTAYSVAYVDKAVINGNQYSLGIFDFKLLPFGNEVKVQIDASGLQDIGVVETNPKKYILEGRKGSVTQTIELVAPSLIQLRAGGNIEFIATVKKQSQL